MTALPIVSLAAGPADLGHAIRDACEGSGFFYLKDYGINQLDIEKAFKRARKAVAKATS